LRSATIKFEGFFRSTDDRADVSSGEIIRVASRLLADAQLFFWDCSVLPEYVDRGLAERVLGEDLRPESYGSHVDQLTGDLGELAQLRFAAKTPCACCKKWVQHARTVGLSLMPAG
jgi:hypothetical protein